MQGTRPMTIQRDHTRRASGRSDDSRDHDSAGPRGVDRSLIDWMLSLSPAERLQVAQDWVAMVDSFGGAGRAD